MDADRRQEAPGPELMDFFTKSNRSAQNIGFSGTFPKLQFLQGQMIPELTVGCFTGEKS